MAREWVWDRDVERWIDRAAPVPTAVPDFPCGICGALRRPWDMSAYYVLDEDGEREVRYMCDRCYDVNREAEFVEGGY